MLYVSYRAKLRISEALARPWDV